MGKKGIAMLPSLARNDLKRKNLHSKNGGLRKGGGGYLS